ncbi:MAG: hypothetical protein FJ286_03450 [Planctomycetes bacterium]|nr:hypothetical protein [Planctomycetota bacterium]
MARRVIATAAACALVILLVRMLLTVRRQVPIVVGCVASYRSPLAIIPLVDEDRALLESLARPGNFFLDPGSAMVYDTSASLASATADEMLATLTSNLRRTKPGGPDGDMAIVYLTAIGTVDERGRPCVVPPGHSDDPTGLDQESYLQVERLLAALRDALPERVGILVVLDACRAVSDWPLGVDDGGFTPAVEALLANSGLKRVWVMVPAATGQHSFASAAQGSSAGVAEFVRGIRGAADIRPWGDADGRVELRELSSYLALHVDHRARTMLGERQTPVVIPAAASDDDDAAIAWTIERDSPVEAPWDGDVSDDAWLADRWRAAERLRPTAIRERPLRWSSYLHMLLRAESLRSAGTAFIDEQLDVDRTVERMETALSLPLIPTARLVPGIRLAYVSQGALDDGNVEVRRWLAAVERYVAIDQPRAAGTKPPAASEDVDGWLLRAEAAWWWLMERCDSDAALDRAAVARWLECVGSRPEGVTYNPVQLHLVRMLIRWADPVDWQRQPEAFRDILRMISKSRQSAYSQDVRADSPVDADDLAQRGNASMRTALDLVFVGGSANVQEAARLSRESIALFDQREMLAKQRRRAIELLDTMRAELPYLAAWWVEEARHLARVPDYRDSALIRTKATDLQALLLAVGQLKQVLDGSVALVDAAETATAALDQAEEVRSRCEAAFLALRSSYLNDCADLATEAPDSPRTLGRIRRVLGVPLVLGDLRTRLLRRASDLDRRQAALMAREPYHPGDPPQPVDPAAAVAGWIEWRNVFTNPVLPTLSSDPAGVTTLPTSAADIAASVGRQVTAVRVAARSLPSILANFDRQRAELEIGRPDGDARVLELLARASSVSRQLAPVVGQRPRIEEGTTATHRYFAAAWHRRLLTYADLTLEEFWGSVEPDEPVYCVHKARVLLDAAGQMLGSNEVVFGDAERARVSARIESLATLDGGFAHLELSPNRLILPPATGVAPPRNKATLTARANVPEGLAAMWLSESVDGQPLELLERGAEDASSSASARTVASRVGVRVALPAVETAWQLDAAAANSLELNRTAVLDLTAWYRGHRLVVGLPVAAAAASRTTEWEAPLRVAPRVTVRGDLPQAQAVAIVFDCSGSMGQRLADGRTRLDAGRAAVAELLDTIAKSGRWDVSLWLYGHRTRWSRDKDGKYVAGLTPAGVAAKAAAGRDGQPFKLVPGDDVEQVLPMQPLTPAVVERIGMTLSPLEPGGETPLYLSISEALKTDFDGGRTDVPGHVLVVTDGANDQTGGRYVTASGVEDQLARKNGRRRSPLRIDVVGFGFSPDGADRASRMDDIRNLATGSGGRFYEAANADSLARSLRESLRVIRWRVRGPDAPPDSASLGASLTLPPPLVGRSLAYEAALESAGNPPRRGFVTEGGEAIELFVGGGGRSLDFRRYDGGTEQGLRDSRTSLFAPSDPQRLIFVGAHLASRAGDTVRFPVSIQNANAAEFSPRPVEAWVEIAPRSKDGAEGAPFVFYDLSFQPNRPVPVLDLAATNWPRSADRAEIRGWFRFTRTPPDVAVTLAELTPGVERRLELSGLPGVEIRVTLTPAEAADHVKLSVVETQVFKAAERLPYVRVCVTPDCLRAVHIVEPETGRVRHEFTVRAEGGRVMPDAQLLITDKQRVQSGAMSLTAGGDAPLTVPVPGE